MRELEKQYDPKQVEDKIYAAWLAGGYFTAQRDPAKKPYTIVMPLPNITGQLHMGHAMDSTLQDILIRVKRMQGYSALWVPGTDHATIATEAKIVAAMKEEGITKEDIGREKFMERAWAWNEKYGGRIVEQLKKLGDSCDWSRLAFTMDEPRSEAVREVFVRLYEQGLIYKGERIINWCPHCKTSISDAEVEYEEEAGALWHIRYPVEHLPGQYITVATTRPETMLGDTAIAVNPEDDRYAALVGKFALLPLVGRRIPIIADSYVEKDFGTGAVKITPAHDPNDFAVGERHNLPLEFAMDEDAVITADYPAYAGLERYAARKAIVDDLEKQGFLVKTEEHLHNVGSCYRCSSHIEPMVSKQWFVKMKPLAAPAIEAVRSGQIKFVPERFDKIYFNWMENIQDWCISRQLWWGHRIPAWYCDECGEIVVSRETPAKCPHCGGVLRQDPDTLDTWFSSALWPFSTLGWPDEQAPDYQYFYPTDVLVTGYDIIFFWVARMIFSGLAHTGSIPFHTVYVHGLVRDELGRKMSKSLGNGVDPLEVIEQYGADALRFSIVTGSTLGNDMRYIDDKVKGYRNFANKLWNAARFVLLHAEATLPAGLPATLEMEDRWVLSLLNTLIGEVTSHIDKYDLNMAATKIYDFIWDIYCDWYIEIAKLRLNGQEKKKAQNAQQVLVYVLQKSLQLLHPFMPYITEELWGALPRGEEAGPIMISAWPKASDALHFPEDEEAMQQTIALIKAIRNVRAEMGVPPSRRTHLTIEAANPAPFRKAQFFLKKFGFADSIAIGDGAPAQTDGQMHVVGEGARAFIPLADLVDKEKERTRLENEKQTARKEIDSLEARLNNPGFTGKAPEAVVQGERDKLARLRERLAQIDKGLQAL